MWLDIHALTLLDNFSSSHIISSSLPEDQESFQVGSVLLAKKNIPITTHSRGVHQVNPTSPSKATEPDGVPGRVLKHYTRVQFSTTQHASD